jgi:hypothetical protein
LTELPLILNEFRGKKWKLLYRATVDGFRGSDFHQKCHLFSNTITIILTTKGFIFGGFTPISWDVSGSYKSDNTKKSFLFTLKNSWNGPPRRFPIKTPSNAINCSASYGPTFGNAHDIYVADNSNGNGSSSTNLGTTYLNDTGWDGKQVFTGEYIGGAKSNGPLRSQHQREFRTP